MFNYNSQSNANYSLSYHVLIPTIAEIFKASVFDIWSKPEVEKFCDFSEFIFNIFGIDLSSIFLLFDRWLYYHRFKP